MFLWMVLNKYISQIEESNYAKQINCCTERRSQRLRVLERCYTSLLQLPLATVWGHLLSLPRTYHVNTILQCLLHYIKINGIIDRWYDVGLWIFGMEANRFDSWFIGFLKKEKKGIFVNSVSHRIHRTFLLRQKIRNK